MSFMEFNNSNIFISNDKIYIQLLGIGSVRAIFLYWYCDFFLYLYPSYIVFLSASSPYDNTFSPQNFNIRRYY